MRKIITGAAVFLMAAIISSSACFALPEETDTAAAAEETYQETSRSEQEIVSEYAEELRAMEAETKAVLTPEEESLGFRIVGNQKYAPGEDPVGDTPDDVNWNGALSSNLTGYVNLVFNVPEYIHEEVYCTITNANTLEIYGVRAYEVNGYSARICVPAGIYFLDEGGLSNDTKHRFYAERNQFNVRRGGMHTIVVDIVDLHPELAPLAVPGYDQDHPSRAATPDTRSTWSNAIRETTAPQETLPSASADPETQTPEKGPFDMLLKVLFSALFSIIPIAVIGLIYFKTRKPKRGFDE